MCLLLYGIHCFDVICLFMVLFHSQLFTKPHPSRNAVSLKKHSLGKDSFLFPSPALSVSNLYNLKLTSVIPKGIDWINCAQRAL